ncbi:MAG: ferritin family protein [Planctomycetes bacterium]|nr:ferritin family protein [Planctomycetota bacterium]
MNVFEFAKKQELKTKALYQAELDKTDNKGLRGILELLISEEDKHYRIFDAMERNETPEDLGAIDLSQMKVKFAAILDKGVSLPEECADFYAKAMEIEKKAENYYREEAGKIENASVSRQLSAIAEEEHKHVVLTENLYLMVSNANPAKWLADAEWSGLDQ